jgi:hypothetical protein
MPDSITPSNPNIPVQAAVPGNVASLATPSTLSNLQNSVSPSTFGDQARNIAKQQAIKAATQSTIAKLYKEKANLIKEGIQLDINHQLTLQKIEIKHTPKKQVQNGKTVDIPAELNDEQYEVAIIAENGGTLPNGKIIEGNYPAAKKNLQERKDANQKAIDDYLKDPFKKQKDARKKRKEKRAKRQKRNKEEKRKARKALAKTVFQNAKKSLVPILTLVLTNQIAKIIAGNDRIGIGLNNPAYKLDVNGDINIPAGNTYRVGGTAGISATITTAALTGGGAQGSMTFVKGILTAQTQAT